MSIFEIITSLWGIIVSIALVYNKYFGKFTIGDDTLFSLDNRYEEKILEAIRAERERGDKRLTQKLQDAEDESNRKLKAQAEEHNQAIEALEAKNAANQEKLFSLIAKVNEYLEKISALQTKIITLQEQNRESEGKLNRLENNAKRNKEALDAARDAASLSDQALREEREARKASEVRLSAEMSTLQRKLEEAQVAIRESELEKARLKGMIEGVAFQQEKEKERLKNADKTSTQN